MQIKIKVIPRAKKERIEKSDDILRVYINEPPVDGKANKKLIEVLARHLGVKKSQISIVSGETCRNKLINIQE